MYNKLKQLVEMDKYQYMISNPARTMSGASRALKNWRRKDQKMNTDVLIKHKKSWDPGKSEYNMMRLKQAKGAVPQNSWRYYKRLKNLISK